MVQSHPPWGEETYKRPVAKIDVMSIFFFNGICSLQTQGIGSTRIAKSEMTLKMPVASKIALTLKQWPVFMRGFQIFFRGVHKAIPNRLTAR